MNSSLTNASIRGVLLDIEGTTTPISFVHEILFPYARAHVRDYLEAHSDSAETFADLSRLREEHDADLAETCRLRRLAMNHGASNSIPSPLMFIG